jgi:NitT/TauT family transport system substrate-binding protein
MKSRWLATYAAVALVCLLAFAAGAGATASKQEAQQAKAATLTPVKLQAAWIPKEEYSWLQGAYKAGIFAKHGIDLQIQWGRGSVLALQVLGGGGADFALATSMAFLQATERGLDAVAIASTTQQDPSVIVSWPQSPVKTVKDLEGKTFQVTTGSSFTLLVNQWLKDNGADPAKVNVVQVDAAAAGALFASHKADAMSWFQTVSLDPLEQQAGVKFNVMQGTAWKGNKTSPNELLIVPSSSLKDKRDVVKRMAHAVSDALTWSAGNPRKAATEMSPLLANAPVEQIVPLVRTQTKLAHTTATTGKPFGWMSKTDWDEVYKTGVAGGLVKPTTRVYWTNGFLPKPKAVATKKTK